jgi:ADP-heptose:LPS heptosyltransferase
MPATFAHLDARRICIIKPSAFGNVVQSLPILGALRQRFPHASIAWVIRQDLVDLVAGHPELDEWLTFDRRGGIWSFLTLLRQLRARRFDLVIDLQGLVRTALMTLATQARVRIGLETGREGASLACNVMISRSGWDVPARDRYWRVAEDLGAGEAERRARIPVARSDHEWAASLVAPLPRPIIAVHPGAMWPTKRCPPDVFAAALHRAHQQFGGSTVIVGAGQDHGPVAVLWKQLVSTDSNSGTPSAAAWLNVTGQTTPKQLAALLSRVDVLLCNDSGPMHLAAALSTPVVGLFTCTDPAVSGPGGAQNYLVSSTAPCAGSYRDKCPWQGAHHLRCHRELPLDRIHRALHAVLSREWIENEKTGAALAGSCCAV